MEAMQWYWKRKVQEYDTRNDDAPETDSGNSKDHSCQPKDTQAGTSWYPPKGKKLRLELLKNVLLLDLRGSSHCLLMKQCLLPVIL